MARVTDIVARLKLLGMISQDASASEAAPIAEQNRPLLPLIRGMNFPRDLVSQLGEGWSIRVNSPAGVSFIERWLQALGSDEGDLDGSASIAAKGWSGDGFLLLDGPSSQKAFVWRIDWFDQDQDIADPSARRRRDQEVAEFSVALHRTLELSPDFQSIPSGLPERSLWQGPGGVLGFQNGNVLGWTSIVVFQDVDLANKGLDILEFL
ncbi:MAG: hypothetical protein O3C10_07975 [Chloroflexi bacterium]|nr:hypothetical protein [Chloroflexota bacterium]